MPGPVSQSMHFFGDFKEDWLDEMKKGKLRYFVLKAIDFLEALTEEEAESFNNMLKKHEAYRKALGKTSSNKYWIVNRDEPYADQVKKLIEDHHGIKL